MQMCYLHTNKLSGRLPSSWSLLSQVCDSAILSTLVVNHSMEFVVIFTMVNKYYHQFDGDYNKKSHAWRFNSGAIFVLHFAKLFNKFRD